MSSSRRSRTTAVLVILLVLAAAALALWRWYERPLQLDAERVEARIAAGSSARAVARQFNDAGVHANELLFVAVARMTGAARALRAGRYEVTRGMTVHDLIDKLRRGEVLRERFTIVEGWTVRDLRAALAATPALRADSSALDDAQLLAALGAAETHLEGLFAPDTYLFDPGSSDLDLLRSAYRAQADRLARAWAARAPGLPLAAPYQLLTLASIVEKETGRAEERTQVAAVFANRLRRGMLLQTDPTIIYGLGAKFDGNLRKQHLLTDGPYNSYTRGGLPPTPIALPGLASLQAAAAPAASRALYFVARGDGSSAFSESLAEHNRAVARYQLKGARR